MNSHPDFTKKIPKVCVQFPPKKKSEGQEVQMICPPDKRGGCGHAGTAVVSSDPEIAKEDKHTVLCPKCRGFMVLYWGNYFRFSIKMGPRGFTETKCGQRRKRDLEWRNRVMERKQWKEVPPMAVTDIDRVRNATPGGAFDPNSKAYVGKKRKKKIYIPK